MISLLSTITGILAMTPAPSSPVNLATRDYDAVALASSMKDTSAHYTDHLIDGADQTIWHSGSGSTKEWPHWVEIRWKHEQQPSEVRLEVAPGHSLPQQWTVERWTGTEWSDVTTVADGATSATFSPVKTEKLRIRFHGEVPAIALREVKVLGQGWRTAERMRPYWGGKYVWHAEKNRQLERNAPRYFRRSFNIDKLSDVAAAYVMSRSNDSYVAFINGKQVSSGSTTIIPVNVKEHLREGENVFAYIATAQSSPGWGKMELIGNLVLYTPENREVIGTDASWISATEELPEWQFPGFKPGAEWTAAAEIGAPPGDPWGEISYPDPGMPVHVEMERLEVTPKTAKPGDEVELKATLRTRHPIKFPFQFEWRLGDQLMRPDLGNFALTSAFFLPSPQVNEWEVGKLYTVSAKARLPRWTPRGRVPVQLGATSTDGLNRSLRINGAGITEPLSFVNVVREEPETSKELTGAAKMARNGMVAAFDINGERVPPVFFGGAMHKNYRAYDAYAQSGSKIVSLHMPGRMAPSEKNLENGMRIFDQQARHLLNLVPDAKIVVSAYLRPSTEWLAANPDGLLKDAFGRTYTESIASERYRKDAAQFVEKMAVAMKELPYGNQIVGFHFVMGAQSDAYIGGVDRNIGEMSRDQWTLGDWNETAIEDLRGFLKDRYKGDVQALRKAWKDEVLTFENATANREALVGTLKNHSLFRNPKEEGMMGPDYCAWISSIIPRVYEEVATQTLKKHFREDVLVFNWSGYLVQLFASIPPGSLQQNNGFWLQHHNYAGTDSVFTGTTNYTTRHDNFRATPFQPLDTIARNGRFGMLEIDYRTFVAGPKVHGRQMRQDESVAVLRREMGTSLIHGGGYYFLEFTGTGNGRTGVGFFDHESLQETLRTSYKTIERAIEEKREPKSAAEIAVVVSAETPWYQDVAYPAVLTHTMINQMLYRNLAGIGAPIDTLQMNDLLDTARMEQYKLILFTNTWYMSDAQREAVERLKGGGRTLCWFYAPGFVHDQEGLSVEASRALTGMNLALIEGREEPKFQTIESDHALLRNVKPGTQIGLEAFGLGHGFNELMPTKIYPNFEVNDEAAVVIGRDQNERARFAVKEMEGWRSVYSAVPDMTPEMLRSLAEFAGVHCYTPAGIVVEANSDYLLLHTHSKEEREIEVALPRSKSVKSVYNDATWEPAKSFKVRLPKGSFSDLYELNEP